MTATVLQAIGDVLVILLGLLLAVGVLAFMAAQQGGQERRTYEAQKKGAAKRQKKLRHRAEIDRERQG